eukprot:m.68583 g.68583  ORF g.68583 m.68583 type:complete len:582 (+) comp8522_c0_seq2:251-1996(+)
MAAGPAVPAVPSYADVAPRLFQTWGNHDDVVLLKLFLDRLPAACRKLIHTMVFETPKGRYLTCEIQAMRLDREMTSLDTIARTCDMLSAYDDNDMDAADDGESNDVEHGMHRTDIGPDATSPTEGLETPYFSPIEWDERVVLLPPLPNLGECAKFLKYVERDLAASSATNVSAATLALLVRRLPPELRHIITWHVFRASSLLVEARRALPPGTKFSGTIKVPGIEDVADDELATEPSEYTMTVLFWSTSALGDPLMYVSHEAYEDRQACDVELSVGRANTGGYEVRVNYRDGETICSGTFDTQRGQISGNVRQLEYGEEGFEYPPEEVTHTFKLAMCREHVVVVTQRAEIIQLRRECARAFSRWQPALGDYAMFPRARISQSAYIHAFFAAVYESEISLAELRSLTRVLRDVKFESPADRLRIMAALEEQGCTRIAAHAKIDTGMLAMRTAVILREHLGTAPPGEGEEEVPFPSLICRNEFQRVLVRGSDGYHKFDEALTSACKRIPLSVLSNWVVPGGGDAECAICITGIDTDETMVVLPCRHTYHKECIVTWAHMSSVCPTCRRPLGDAQGGSQSPNAS